MWFGDLVTMRWWDDLWLNESFATYMSASPGAEAEATRWGHGRLGRRSRNVEKAWAYRQDQLPSTHPIAADIPDMQAVEVNFDGITYAKGASVLEAARGLRRARQLPGRRPQLLQRARLGQHRAEGPASAPWSTRPAATCPPGRRSGWRPPGSTRCALRSRSTPRAGSPGSRCSRRPRPTTRRCAPTASRSASTPTAGRRADPRQARSSSTSSAPAPPWPSWSASSSPTWSWSTTTT